MQEAETAQTGGDDLRSQIMSAMEVPDENTEIEAEDTELAEDDPLETNEGRDERGRFKKKEAAEGAKAESDESAKTEVQPEQKLDVAPPQHWKGAGKVDWNKLPANVKQAIAEDYKSLEESTGKYQGLEQVLQPRRDALQANYGSVESGLDYLFKLSDFASNDPQGFVSWFAQQRGVSLHAPQGGQSQDSPDLSAAMQKIQQLEQQISQLPTQLQQQSQTTALQSQIQSFANDPANVYFNDVKQAMSGLLNSGEAKDLQQAYEMATWAHPQIRAQLIAEQQEKAAEEKRRKAEAAKSAASSMRGSPVNGASMEDEPADSIRGELIRAMGSNRV